MKVIGFAGSNSTNSINKKLVDHCLSCFEADSSEILDLNDFEMAIYSADREKSAGVPSLAIDFANKIDSADLLIISLAEHNGAYTTAFKNIFDWVSRIPTRKAFGGKPILLMSTSPGPRGGSSVLEIAKNRFPFNGGVILETFSLPRFNDNFSQEKGIIDELLMQELFEKIKIVKNKMKI